MEFAGWYPLTESQQREAIRRFTFYWWDRNSYIGKFEIYQKLESLLPSALRGRNRRATLALIATTLSLANSGGRYVPNSERTRRKPSTKRDLVTPMVEELLSEGRIVSVRRMTDELNLRDGVSVKKSLVGSIKKELSSRVTPPPSPVPSCYSEHSEATTMVLSPTPPALVVAPLPAEASLPLLPDPVPIPFVLGSSPTTDSIAPTGSIPTLSPIPSDDSSSGSIPGDFEVCGDAILDLQQWWLGAPNEILSGPAPKPLVHPPPAEWHMQRGFDLPLPPPTDTPKPKPKPKPKLTLRHLLEPMPYDGKEHLISHSVGNSPQEVCSEEASSSSSSDEDYAPSTTNGRSVQGQFAKGHIPWNKRS